MKGKVLTFYMHGSAFGIDVRLVKEINSNVEFTPVPCARLHIAGLFNMRGQIVTLINLAKVLLYDEHQFGGNPACIILKAMPDESQYLGLLVDRMGAVAEVEEEWCEPVPPNITDLDVKYLKEVIKLQDMLVMLIDPVRVTE